MKRCPLALKNKELNVKEIRKTVDDFSAKLESKLDIHRKELHKEVKTQIGDVQEKIEARINGRSFAS